MTASSGKIHRFPRFAPILPAVFTLAACASVPPPLGDLADAETRIAHARELHAERHAPDELALADARLRAARAALADKDNVLARQQAIEAQVEADLAAAKARAADLSEQVEAREAENRQLRRQLGLQK